MPNVAPRGLFARYAGAWKNPAAVYARDAGAWKKVSYIYAYRNGAWQLIWGANPVAPTSASAAWVQPHSVRVTIVPPAVNTNTSWVVRRFDGSIVDTVPVGTLVVDDPTPLVSSSSTGNKTLGAYTVEGTDGATSSAKVSTNTVVWNLDAATQAAAVTYPDATTATVTVSWTPNATYGDPDGWKVYRAEGPVWYPATGVLAGSARSYAAIGQGRGVAYNFRAIPMVLAPDGVTYVQAGNAVNVAALSKAVTPTGLALTAPTNPILALRLNWTAPAGTRTGYEIQKSTNGTAWVASGCLTAPSTGVSYASGIWKEGTVVIGEAALEDGCITPNVNSTRAYVEVAAASYVRIRALSAGGASDWVQVGPVTPVVDTTPPPAATITTWKPESSYGRMVVRGTWANNADVAFGEMYFRVGTAAYTKVWGKTAVTPGAAFGVALTTESAGEVVTALVRTWDAYGNYSDKTAVYTLVASPKIVSAIDSATWRTDEWRTDGVSGSTGVMYGWTSTGHNIGCWFYGEALQDFISTHTVVSATVEYVRDGSSQGMSAASPVMIQVHTAATKPAGAPGYSSSGEVAGSAVARVTSPPGDGGYATLSATQLGLLAGAYKGICCYDGVANGNTYMRLYPYGTVGDGRTSGKVTVNHLG